MKSSQYNAKELSGRNRRLLYEWQQLEQGLAGRSDISWQISKTNAEGLPVGYLIDYHIHSICGVTDVERLNEPDVENKPLYADHFRMQLDLPAKYPCVDGAPVLNFLTSTPTGEPLPHPWHPNIRSIWPIPIPNCCGASDAWHLTCDTTPIMPHWSLPTLKTCKWQHGFAVRERNTGFS